MTDKNQQPDRFISISEAVKMLGLSPATFYRRVEDTPNFPRPFLVGKAKKVSLNEVVAYQVACKASRY